MATTERRNDGDFWQHDPEVCGTMECPGCYAEAYVPPKRRADFAEHLDEVYRTVQPNERPGE